MKIVILNLVQNVDGKIKAIAKNYLLISLSNLAAAELSGLMR